MNMRTLFRLIVLLGLASGLLAGLVDHLVSDPVLEGLKQTARQAIEELPRWRTVTVGFLGLFALAGYLVGSVALVFFRAWGRPLYVGAHGLILLGYLLGVPVVYGNWAFTLNELSMLAGGVAMAMMYIEPLATAFRK